MNPSTLVHNASFGKARMHLPGINAICHPGYVAAHF